MSPRTGMNSEESRRSVKTTSGPACVAPTLSRAHCYNAAPTRPTERECDDASPAAVRLHRRVHRRRAAAAGTAPLRRMALLRRRRRRARSIRRSIRSRARNVNNLEIAWRWSSPDNEIVKANPACAAGRAIRTRRSWSNGVLYTTTSLGVFAAIDPATRQDAVAVRPRDLEGWPAAEPRLHAPRHRPTGPTARSARIISGTHDAHLVSIDAETGKPDPAFGDNGRVGRHRRPAVRRTHAQLRDQLHAGRRQERRSSPARTSPTVRRSRKQPRGDIFGFDVQDRQEALDVPFGSAAGRVRQRDLGERLAEVHRQHERLVDDHRRRGARLRLSAVRHADQRLLRRPSARQQPVCRKPRLPRRDDRQARLAFPGACTTACGTTTFRRRRSWSTSPSNGRRIKAVAQVSKQGFVYVFDRKTGEPVWPIEERPVPQSTRARRTDVADAAVSDQAAGVRSPGPASTTT